MLSHSELKELSAISANKNFFVSFYLNVNPLTNPKGDFIIHFKNMLKEASEEISKDKEKKVKNDLKKIESFLKYNKREFKKGVAIISSDSLGIWKVYHIALPVKNELIIDKTPYIKPLIFLLNNYQRCAVLLVDRELARIFIIHLGEIEEYTELFTPDIPGKHKKGGWFSLQQKRFERHIDYHVGLHIKDVIKTLEEFFHKEDINNIILGGSEEAIVKVKNMLSKTIPKKLTSTFNAEITMGGKEVLEMTLKITDELEEKKEKKLVEELITMSMKNTMAVTGIENVLINLQEGRVMRLVLLRDIKTNGFRCTNCSFLTVQPLRSCPYCEGNFEEIHYMIDFAAQKAVEMGAPIEIITKSADLIRAGGIGAFLRF